MKTTVKFHPNERAKEETVFPNNEEFIKYVAERNGQDPESVIVVPFSELEGNIVQVDSNLMADGYPIQMDVAGEVNFTPAPEEPPSVLGEALVEELDSFDPPHPTEIQNQVTAYIIGEDFTPAKTVIESEADIEKLEKEATGDVIPGSYYHPNHREGQNG